MFCFPAIFYHVGNPYTGFSYGFLFLHFFLFPLGSSLSVLQSCGGNIKHWPCSSTARWFEPFTSERLQLDVVYTE